ncbi:hypothetical protein AAF712_016052 [Marasmius tenuissimus]|uniref:CxC1-like cysteine cluster associated with KDZ transposases domain-containing protein n=1 Tax=Marasmius tenuissimus TaxID=585030 RepID=A0ABR2Z988_9AGAR
MGKLGGSKKVKVSYGSKNGSTAKREVRKLSRKVDQLEREREIYMKHYGGLSFEARDIIDSVGLHDPNFGLDDICEDEDDVDFSYPNDLNGMPIFPPGEEALLQSHEGREYEEILTSLLANRNRSSDTRTRTDRVQKQVDSWAAQIPELSRAYLSFLANGLPSNDANEPSWSIRTVGFESHEERDIFHHQSSTSINVSLARHGLIGSSPDHPTLAFPLHFLHSFRQIRRVCPRYGIDSLARSVQHVHYLPGGTALDDQLRTAYDAYLAILRHVKTLSLDALGRNNEASRTLTTCPSCTYKLRDEPPLHPSMLIAMDGNNSLKLIDTEYKSGKPRTDHRTLPDHRWLEDSHVDLFKDEVAKSRSKSKSKSANSTSSSKEEDGGIAWLEVVENDELAPCLDTCVDRWRNAGPEARKKMCALFAVAGIFLAVCRHGHLLVVCDMVRSGELMKYPLAITDALLHMYGDDLALGYDIMCAFHKTLQRSELLSSDIQKSRLVGVVPAFHGHAHNRKCQCQWHPQYIPGVGIEDFEGCERTFSLSNNLASTTRLATPFHRRQAILEHFDFNDDDKHALSGNFIYQNYREALERLQEDEPLFEDACRKYGLSPMACEAFLIKEKEYFATAVEESVEMTQILDYVEALIKWWKAEKVSRDAHDKFLTLPRNRHQMSGKQVRQVEARNRTTFERAKIINEELHTLEDDIGIPERWTSECTEYSEARKKLVNRRYRQALETLEKLVVQRLFELTKLNMSGVGYKQREKISKALRARAEAIRKALETYNELATQVTPPRPTLTFNQIIEMVSVADFDLLKDTQRNISQFIWAKEEHREAMRLHFRIRRAKEEIHRLNVEMKRLITFLIDDHADYHHAIKATQSTDPELAAELSRQQLYRVTVHTRIVQRLAQTSAFEGFTGEFLPRLQKWVLIKLFTGSLLPGERLSRNSTITDNAPLPPWCDIIGLVRAGEAYHEVPRRELTANEAAGLDEEHVEREAESDGLITFMQGLTVNQGSELEPEV